MLKQVEIAALALVLLAAQGAQPDRSVHGNVTTSEREPKVRIELPKSAQYLGADRWVLYGIANCELHAFIESDGQKQKIVQHLYWVQFEAYIPTKPELKHTYDSPRHTELGGKDFYVDTWVRAKDEPTEPGSDLEHLQALIRSKGYTMPDGMMSVRLVHLLDATKRKELMIIYAEDLSATGLTASDLKKGGSAYDRWPALEIGLIDRAKQNIRLDFAAP